MREKRKRLHHAAASESIVNLKSYLESDVHYPPKMHNYKSMNYFN